MYGWGNYACLEGGDRWLCVHNSRIPMNILLVILYITDNCILGTKDQKGN